MTNREVKLTFLNKYLKFRYDKMVNSLFIDMMFEQEPQLQLAEINLGQLIPLNATDETQLLNLFLYSFTTIKPSYIGKVDTFNATLTDLSNIARFLMIYKISSQINLNYIKQPDLFAFFTILMNRVNSNYNKLVSEDLLKYLATFKSDHGALISAYRKLIEIDGKYDYYSMMTLKPDGFPYGITKIMNKLLYEVIRKGEFNENFPVDEPNEPLLIQFNEDVKQPYIVDNFKVVAQQRLNELYPDLNMILRQHSNECRVILAGGSVSLACSNIWDTYKQQTDLDFFLVGEAASKRNTLNYIISYFTKKQAKFYNRGSVLEIVVRGSPKIQVIFSDAENIFELLYSFDQSHIQICLTELGIVFTPEWARYTPFGVSKLMIPFLRIPRLIKTLSRGYRLVSDYDKVRLYYNVKVKGKNKDFAGTRYVEIKPEQHTIDSQANISGLENYSSYQTKTTQQPIDVITLVTKNLVKQGAFRGGMLEYNNSAHAGSYYNFKTNGTEFSVNGLQLVYNVKIAPSGNSLLLECYMIFLPSDDNYHYIEVINKDPFKLNRYRYSIHDFKSADTTINRLIDYDKIKAGAIKVFINCVFQPSTIFLDIDNNIVDPYIVEPDNEYEYMAIISGAPRATIRTIFRRPIGTFSNMVMSRFIPRV